MRKTRKPTGMPEMIPVSAAARHCGCGVSYIHKIIRTRPKLLNARQMFGTTRLEGSSRGAEALRLEIAQNRKKES